MFRRPDNSIGFSFTRLITNAIPVFSNDYNGASALEPWRVDLLFTSQLALPVPSQLSPQSYQVAGICDALSTSSKIHDALRKSGVISASGLVDTTRITKHFANQLAVISIVGQRKLVNMLFLWEEECVRWRLLAQEEARILKALREGEGLGEEHPHSEMQTALRVVRAKMAVPPSLRAEGVQEPALPPRYVKSGI
ncbi:MAG: hypothetical protein M1829_000346 [Trizodia sp. TS-e1964]|nr:MAG: hypothetical protein M1829_000346 [Trizodia sp. TS-e1964]